jgi:hypothetical protein
LLNDFKFLLANYTPWFINTFLRTQTTNFEFMIRCFFFSFAVFMVTMANAQILKSKDTLAHKKMVQLSGGVYSGIYKLMKENTEYKSNDLGMDIGAEARVMLNLIKRISFSLGFITARRESNL